MLLGGSIEDNLFQIEGLEAHLDTLVGAGGNYVRCTMSSRDPGDVWPFEQNHDTGLYDLDQPGKTYWQKFAQFLEACAKRKIILQIEVWDRFDFAREPWQANPFNPKNNLNYSSKSSGLPERIDTHPGQKENPFFRTAPEQEDNEEVRKYQHVFVDKLLELSLPYGNVLYCIDNETNESPLWSAYWAGYLKLLAEQQGVTIQVTEMWDAWDLSDPEHSATFDHPELYSFVDISQNNHQVGLEHWLNPLKVRERLKVHPRPMNSVKIYGANSGRYGTNRDAQERFWRAVLAGFASVRFHRPPSGLGLSDVAQRHIKSMRLLLDRFDLFRAEPALALLHNRSRNEAYASAGPDDTYAVFFPDGGEVSLEVKHPEHVYGLEWLDIGSSTWVSSEQTFESSGQIQLKTPREDGYWAVLVKPSFL